MKVDVSRYQPTNVLIRYPCRPTRTLLVTQLLQKQQRTNQPTVLYSYLLVAQLLRKQHRRKLQSQPNRTCLFIAVLLQKAAKDKYRNNPLLLARRSTATKTTTSLIPEPPFSYLLVPPLPQQRQNYRQCTITEPPMRTTCS